MLKLRTLIEDGDPELIATNFEFLEGPVWKDGALYFSDIPANRTYRWAGSREEGPSVWCDPTGNANGMTLLLATAKTINRGQCGSAN